MYNMYKCIDKIVQSNNCINEIIIYICQLFKF